MEYILENVVSDSLYSFQERITSQAFPWHLSRAEQIKEQLYSSSYQVAKKERRTFFCLKTICQITYAFKTFGTFGIFQNGKITLETLQCSCDTWVFIFTSNYLPVLICQSYCLLYYKSKNNPLVDQIKGDIDIIICSFPMGQFLAMVLNNQNSL